MSFLDRLKLCHGFNRSSAVGCSEVTIFSLKGAEVIVVDFWIALEALSATDRLLTRCENSSACGHVQNDVASLLSEDILTDHSALRGIDKVDDRWRPWEDTWKKNHHVDGFAFLLQQLQSRFFGFLSFTIFEVSIVAGVSPGRLLIRHIDLFTAEYSRVVFLLIAANKCHALSMSPRSAVLA